MKVYFHHVGVKGADRDFPKTVYSKVSLDLFYQYLPNETKDIYIPILESLYPERVFSCWGVPSGAQSVIRNLSDGDYVILVKKSSFSGSVPVLAYVSLYIPVELPSLSSALWGESKFPYIFTCDVNQMNLTWGEFVNQLGYKTNFRPTGQFYSIQDDRLIKGFGGPEGYISYLHENHVVDYSTEFSGDILFAHESPTDYIPAWKDIASFSNENKELLVTERRNYALSRIGQGKFRTDLLSYWGGCSVTGVTKTDVLIASHIKPWRASVNTERLDPYNGLILIPNLDRLFDRGLISFDSEGHILISSKLSVDELNAMGVHEEIKLKKFESMHQHYFEYHREYVFKS